MCRKPTKLIGMLGIFVAFGVSCGDVATMLRLAGSIHGTVPVMDGGYKSNAVDRI